jgi:hypothetical protein
LGGSTDDNGVIIVCKCFNTYLFYLKSRHLIVRNLDAWLHHLIVLPEMDLTEKFIPTTDCLRFIGAGKLA